MNKTPRWKFLSVVAVGISIAIYAFNAMGAPVDPGFLTALPALESIGSVSGNLALAGLAVGSTGVPELKQLIEDQGRAWEEFKSANDERLKAVEEKGYAPLDLVEKVGAINVDLSKLSDEIGDVMKKQNRPDMGGSDELTADQVEHKEALSKYLRKGEDAGLHALEHKALSSGSDPDGGYILGSEMDSEIDRIAATISGMRSVARIRTIGDASYKKLVKTRGVSGGWLAEAGTSSESTEQQWSEIEITPAKAYAEPWVPNEMLEDAFYDLEADLTDEAGITLGETEAAAFITGNGVGRPRGIASYTAVANASYAWGSVGYIASGAAGAFATSAPADQLIQLQHALKAQYRPGAVFMMNDATLGTARQMKDASGAYYLWNPDPTAGFGGRFLGSPVVIDDNFADIAANSYSMAYGNFDRGYTIVDRRGIAVIRDPYTKKGVTKFHFSKRVGGQITNFEAVKLMKFASS